MEEKEEESTRSGPHACSSRWLAGAPSGTGGAVSGGNGGGEGGCLTVNPVRLAQPQRAFVMLKLEKDECSVRLSPRRGPCPRSIQPSPGVRKLLS